MSYRPRIFIHAPFKPDPAQTAAKFALLAKISECGFEPQEYGVSGIPTSRDWSLDDAVDLMRVCDGAAILALERLKDSNGRPLPSEFSHVEGALSRARGLPTLVISESEMARRGVLTMGQGLINFSIDIQDPKSVDQFAQSAHFKDWVTMVRNRKDVFFGYSSAGKKLAVNIREYLRSEGLQVLDWSEDFRHSNTILEEIQSAASRCRCGLFLFTADDRLAWSRMAVPRGNVLLETGYFLSAAGRSRTFIVKERHAKIPSDLDGVIYAEIKHRRDWRPTAERIASQISTRLRDGLK